MTEQEYINITELKSIVIARSILLDICPEGSIVIGSVDYQNIVRILSKWERELFKIAEDSTGVRDESK